MLRELKLEEIELPDVINVNESLELEIVGTEVDVEELFELESEETFAELVG